MGRRLGVWRSVLLLVRGICTKRLLKGKVTVLSSKRFEAVMVR